MEPMEPTEAAPQDPGGRPRRPGTAVDWPAVLWGAGAGLLSVVVVATARAVLDRNVDDFDDSGWVLVLFVLLLAAYFAAGWIAQQRCVATGGGDAPLTHGALAGIGAFVLWIPIRVVIWVARDETRGLFRGSDAALRPGQLFGGLVIAAGIGMLGGFVAARVAARRRTAQDA